MQTLYCILIPIFYKSKNESEKKSQFIILNKIFDVDKTRKIGYEN